MLVDNSVVVRRLLTDALTAHGAVSVVAIAENGARALARLEKIEVDAIILDIAMPEMDGLTMLRQLRQRRRRIPVIMFSTLTDRGASATFDALLAGASDYVLKPDSAGEFASVVAESLVPKLLALASSPYVPAGSQLSVAAPRSTQAGANSARQERKPEIVHRPSEAARSKCKPVRVVGIASSTGGPSALDALLSRLPRSFSAPIVIAQHMPPLFTRTLAERLALHSELRVVESAGDEILAPGHVYIAPGNRHIEVVQRGAALATRVSDGPRENFCRPSADVLFRSLALACGPSALVAVLTGMGSDGALGARAVYQHGGRVLAQSGPSCVVWGMPRAVEEAGVAEAVVSLSELPAALLRYVGHPRAAAVRG